jgi:hypothetical protein
MLPAVELLRPAHDFASGVLPLDQCVVCQRHEGLDRAIASIGFPRLPKSLKEPLWSHDRHAS